MRISDWSSDVCSSDLVLLHPLALGFLLSAILAAIMSTISAQLLVTGSSLTEDFYRLFVRRQAGETEIVTVGRLSIVAVAAVAMLLAQNPNGSVLKLVANAWAGFGPAFGPEAGERPGQGRGGADRGR